MAKATINPSTLHPSGLASTGLSPKSRPYDGGPAFPSPSVVTSDGGRMPSGYPGVSLRAYFAAHAPPVPGDFLRHMDIECFYGRADGRKEVGARPETTLELTARWCLAYADAMIKGLK